MIISILVCILLALPVSAMSGAVEEIISDLNSQMRIPYVRAADVELTCRKVSGRTDRKAFELHMAVYLGGLEKSLIRMAAPGRYRGIKLLVSRGERTTVYFVDKKGKPFRTGSDPSSRFFKTNVLNVDFVVIEKNNNWNFQAKGPGMISAKSRSLSRTVYSERILTVSKRNSSWVTEKVEFFYEGILLKTGVYSDFVEVAPRCWRPGKIVLTGPKMTTTLIFHGWETNNKIPEKIFRLR